MVYLLITGLCHSTQYFKPTIKKRYQNCLKNCICGHWISNSSVYILTALAYKLSEQTSTLSMLQTTCQRLSEKSLFSKSNINIMTANTYFTPQMFPTKYPASYTYVKKIARVATEWTKLLYWFDILSHTWAQFYNGVTIRYISFSTC